MQFGIFILVDLIKIGCGLIYWVNCGLGMYLVNEEWKRTENGDINENGIQNNKINIFGLLINLWLFSRVCYFIKFLFFIIKN